MPGKESVSMEAVPGRRPLWYTKRVLPRWIRCSIHMYGGLLQTDGGCPDQAERGAASPCALSPYRRVERSADRATSRDRVLRCGPFPLAGRSNQLLASWVCQCVLFGVIRSPSSISRFTLLRSAFA